MTPTRRNLDGFYCRAERDGKWQPVCFTDLTEAEQRTVMLGCTDESFDRMTEHFKSRIALVEQVLSPEERAHVYATMLRVMGDGFEIVAGDDECE